jgi:toxin ParE2
VNWQVTVRKSAVADVDRIVDWYRSHRFDLAERFAARFDDTLDALSERPMSFGVVRGAVRRAPISGFPHGIFFRVKGAKVSVVAVFHGSQSPQRWKSRGI